MMGFFSPRYRFQTGSWAHPASYPMCTGGGGSFPGDKATGSVKLTTHLHLVPRLRTRGAIPPLNQYVFMAWYLVKHMDTLPYLQLQGFVPLPCLWFLTVKGMFHTICMYVCMYVHMYYVILDNCFIVIAVKAKDKLACTFRTAAMLFCTLEKDCRNESIMLSYYLIPRLLH
jgi:hypothetical protein